MRDLEGLIVVGTGRVVETSEQVCPFVVVKDAGVVTCQLTPVAAA